MMPREGRNRAQRSELAPRSFGRHALVFDLLTVVFATIGEHPHGLVLATARARTHAILHVALAIVQQTHGRQDSVVNALVLARSSCSGPRQTRHADRRANDR